MKYHIELETEDFIPQADMSNTPGLIEFLKAMLPNEISAFRITKEGAAGVGEFEMGPDVVYGIEAIYQKLKFGQDLN